MSRNHLYAQHFLRSPQLVLELIGHTNIRKNDIVYDLGAGSGVITEALAKRCKQVIAVEIEPDALRKLEQHSVRLPNVTILNQDIATLKPQHDSYKIFANIPFNLSSDIVRHFAFEVTCPKSLYLIVQKQFARKLVPGNDHFTSQLSAELAPFFTVKIRKPLRKTDFTPPPAVDTVLIEIKPREVALMDLGKQEEYRRYIEQCFSRQKFFLRQPREEATISAELRPSQLTPEQWCQLFSIAKY